MPFMNGVRVLGINRTTGIDDYRYWLGICPFSTCVWMMMMFLMMLLLLIGHMTWCCSRTHATPTTALCSDRDQRTKDNSRSLGVPCHQELPRFIATGSRFISVNTCTHSTYR
jgi:hypothetical protein